MTIPGVAMFSATLGLRRALMDGETSFCIERVVQRLRCITNLAYEQAYSSVIVSVGFWVGSDNNVPSSPRS